MNTDREVISTLALDFIGGAYESWRVRCRDDIRARKKEPSLTATIVRDYILGHANCPNSLRFESRKRSDAVVRSILASLKQRRILTTSIGIGEYGGEARCYEPVAHQEFVCQECDAIGVAKTCPDGRCEKCCLEKCKGYCEQ